MTGGYHIILAEVAMRRLRELGDFTRRGVQRQLAREFGVSASVICKDL
jgi:hypothetical protein